MQYIRTVIHDTDRGEWIWRLGTLQGKRLAEGTSTSKGNAELAAVKWARKHKCNKNQSYFSEIIDV